MNLPDRFAVFESAELQTGVLQICNKEQLTYNFEDVWRIYPESQSRRLPTVVHGRLDEINHHPVFGRARVQVRHNYEVTAYYCVTPLVVRPVNLRDGSQVDEELPVVLMGNEYLYGHARPALTYTIEAVPFDRWRFTVYEYHMELLRRFNLPGEYEYRRQRVDLPRPDIEFHRGVRERRRRADTPPPLELDTLLQPPHPTRVAEEVSRPAERIALAIARDFQRQGELCPITQESLKMGEICVTGCFCVFQADALRTWARSKSTCPSCRKSLVYRSVTVEEEAPNVMIGH